MTDGDDNSEDGAPGTDSAERESGRPRLRGGSRAVEQRRDTNRMLARRSPVEHSDSALVSRDYQPRVGGPELLASWPLGPPPAQAAPDDDAWRITESEPITLQRNYLPVAYVAPIGCSIAYLNVCGRAWTGSAGAELTLELTTDHVQRSGEPYETSVEISGEDADYVLAPMVEFAPDTGDYEPDGCVVAGYELRASVSGGIGFVDQGTAVHLWSE
ncbi:hypothetical protein ACFQL1_22745 [Halomicroarcula sp. GCM10025709]|uniref:hypothetical protein n=1 Tax=Haloarcula TaxID=2237 RepID=UPI0024C383B0|nr:hypothetical protein [Halomicroarcula sp. YJ-61-S]